ncbi:MAG: phosphate transport regulator [Gemmatimonadetes bacterium]|nr:phosphate transport regulator [Gemmatimonadota bacterium]
MATGSPVMTKVAMVRELGVTALQLPALLGDALEANDAAKYLLTLLQAAAHHAEHPDAAPPSLRRERELAGVAEPDFDLSIDAARLDEERRVQVEALPRIAERLAVCLDRMLAPLELNRNGRPDLPTLRARRDDLGRWLRSLADRLDRADLRRLASGVRDQGDSVHLLVLDLHRALNDLQIATASESIDGAHVFALEPEHRPLVEAFMRGLNRTAPLKLDHPGLGTTATQAGPRLIIQNDIGTNDVHLLMLAVADGAVTVTYSDLHPRRLAFFQRMLEPAGFEWQEAREGQLASAHEHPGYRLSIGVARPADPLALRACLEHVGSRIVFLIDWNRARKRLRRFLPKREAIRLLDWAAEHDVGHMPWLVMGGERLVFEALEASRLPIRLGEALHELLGLDRAVEFLQFVLATCSAGHQRGRSDFLVRDEIRSELETHLQVSKESMLGLAVDHGTLIVEVAAAVREAVPRASRGQQLEVSRAAERAARWEHEADQLLNQARAAARRWPGGDALVALLATADDAIDALEEAAFFLTLSGPGTVESAAGTALVALADVAATGAREYRKALENARLLYRGRGRVEWADFSEAVDGVLAAEHRGDEALRRVRAALLASAIEPRLLHVALEVARSIEKATDGLMHAALALRNRVLEEAAG